MNELIGSLMLAILFGTLFGFMARDSSWRVAAMVYMTTGAVVLYITIAVFFLTGVWWNE